MFYINKSDVVTLLVKLFPKLKDEVLENTKEYPSVFLHLIFGDIFNPYLLNLLDYPDKKNHELKKAGDLLEQMSLSSNDLILEVVVVTVIERLQDNPKQLDLFKNYLGDATLRLLEDVS